MCTHWNKAQAHTPKKKILNFKSSAICSQWLMFSVSGCFFFLCVKAAGFALLLSLYIEAQCHYLSTLNSLF